jgi:hypothetical protein
VDAHLFYLNEDVILDYPFCTIKTNLNNL